MDFEQADATAELHKSIAMRVYSDILRGEYALLGVYLPEEVLDRVAELCEESRNYFGYEKGRAALKIVSPMLSEVLDKIRDYEQPNRRWRVLVKNVCRIFEKCRGSLCGADLSGLDLTECDFSTTALSSLGLAAKLDGSLLRFDSFVRYRLPGLRRGEEPQMALDVSPDGRVIMGCGGLIMNIVPEMPLESSVLCDISRELGDGWSICKLRFARSGGYIMVSATSDLAAFDAATGISPSSDAYVTLRSWLCDGANLIPCRDERETGHGAVLRSRGGETAAYLEGWELARFRERHCWELATGDPVRDELSARDRLFSGDLRYKYENRRITNREERSALAFVHAGAASPAQAKQSLCAVNTTAAGCELSRIHPESVITPEQMDILRGNNN